MVIVWRGRANVATQRLRLGVQRSVHARRLVPRTGLEPVRPLAGKRRILSPLCLPISPSRRWTHGRPPEAKAPATEVAGACRFGGATRSRTGLDGFAIRCITALLSRQITANALDKKGKQLLPLRNHSADRSGASSKASIMYHFTACPGGTGQHSPEPLTKSKGTTWSLLTVPGAGKESRTLDLNLGKVALYQLSYSRI